jgi:hypothetical protein
LAKCQKYAFHRQTKVTVLWFVNAQIKVKGKKQISYTTFYVLTAIYFEIAAEGSYVMEGHIIGCLKYSLA